MCRPVGQISTPATPAAVHSRGVPAPCTAPQLFHKPDALAPPGLAMRVRCRTGMPRSTVAGRSRPLQRALPSLSATRVAAAGPARRRSARAGRGLRGRASSTATVLHAAIDRPAALQNRVPLCSSAALRLSRTWDGAPASVSQPRCHGFELTETPSNVGAQPDKAESRSRRAVMLTSRTGIGLSRMEYLITNS
jgi:hypothetical protein